jgi:hypothetical protein
MRLQAVHAYGLMAVTNLQLEKFGLPGQHLIGARGGMAPPRLLYTWLAAIKAAAAWLGGHLGIRKWHL